MCIQVIFLCVDFFGLVGFVRYGRISSYTHSLVTKLLLNYNTKKIRFVDILVLRDLICEKFGNTILKVIIFKFIFLFPFLDF
jgi:hypothetical protein